MKDVIYKLKKWFLSRKLKQKVRILFSALLLVYFLVFAVLYNVVLRGSLSEYIKETNKNTLLSIGSNLNTEIDNISTLSILVMENTHILAYLRGTDGRESASAFNALSSIYGITTSFKNISSAYIMKENGEYIDIANEVTKVDTKQVLSDTWQKEVKEKAGAYTIRINGDGAFETLSGNTVISFIRQINDVNTQKPLGTLVVNCSVNLLENTYSEIADSSKKFGYFNGEGVYICGGSVFSAADKIDIYKQPDFFVEQAGHNEMMYYYQIPNTPLVAAEYEKINYLKYFSVQSLMLIFAVILLTACVVVLLGVFISYYITGPIERLVVSMNQVKEGWLKRVSIKLPDDEIGHLKDSYNMMLVEINQLIGELVENEKNLQKAELEALQEQIKPHFLYNTLDTIGYLSLESRGEETYDAIETLGNFYRKFLSKGSREITIREEIQIVKDYLKLQKLRYDDIFEDEYETDEKVLMVCVPKLILQPLVENSLYHGIRLKGERGKIKITAAKEHGNIKISIYDTGIGMTEEQISKLMLGEGRSFGLRRTIERIQNYYNEADVYVIKSEVGYYCEVILRFPMEKEKTDVQSNDCR